MTEYIHIYYGDQNIEHRYTIYNRDFIILANQLLEHIITLYNSIQSRVHNTLKPMQSMTWHLGQWNHTHISYILHIYGSVTYPQICMRRSLPWHHTRDFQDPLSCLQIQKAITLHYDLQYLEKHFQEQSYLYNFVMIAILMIV